MKPRFNKITIIGVGLIGGSIGLAVRNRHLAQKVTGVFRRESTMKRALKRRAVDSGVMKIKDGVKGADLIILATPVYSIPAVAREAIRYAKRGAVITDVGSTKRWLVGRMEGMIRSKPVFFVGSHPMAGSEHAGVEFAKVDLLKGSPCIVTKTSRTDNRALAAVVGFWKALGAKVKVMDPVSHDKSVALISHLPHLMAFGLAGAVPEKELVYAAEGFKDTTRVASSDPVLWADIFLSNKKEILRSARMFESYYKKIISALNRGRHSQVAGLLAAAKRKRDKLNYGS